MRILSFASCTKSIVGRQPRSENAVWLLSVKQCSATPQINELELSTQRTGEEKQVGSSDTYLSRLSTSPTHTMVCLTENELMRRPKDTAPTNLNQVTETN